jgi:hypothetical protein
MSFDDDLGPPEKEDGPGDDSGTTPPTTPRQQQSNGHGDYGIAKPDAVDARLIRFGLLPDTTTQAATTLDPYRERLLRFMPHLAAEPRPPRSPVRPVGDASAWANTVFAGEVDKVATTAEGSRNWTLNNSALRLYRVALAGALDKDIVTEAMTDAASRAGLGDKEIRATLRSAWNGAEKNGPADDVPEEREPTVIEVEPGALGGHEEVPGALGGHEEVLRGGHEEVLRDDADPEPPLYASRILTRSDLLELPDPEPLIDNVLDRGTTALLYGKWGTAKSFIALDWGLSVSTGRKWQGRAVQRRRVLYVAAEGAFGFKGRVDAWETGWHTKVADADFAILPFPVNLTRPPEVANLAALIAWGGYDFVILDTLARCMVGADENSAKDCGIVVDSMTRLLGHTPGGRGCVLGAHHAGKDGKTLRGSSAFEGAADTVYFTSRDGAVITLDREKRKDGPELDRHQLIIDPIDGTHSAVISAQNLSAWQADKPERAQQLLSTFVRHFEHTGASKAELRLVAELPPSTFHRSLSSLLEHGDLINTGTDKRPFYMLASK